MNIINIALGVDTQPCSSITLGRRGENEVTQIVVDFSSWVEEFGAGVITLLAMRSQDTSAYPVVLSLDGNTATWDVTSTDTAYKGSGRAEYIYTVGEQIAKSVVFSTVVLQDIGEPSETPPDPYEDWLERLTELGAETQANAEAAEQSAEDAAQSAQEAAEAAASVEGAVEQAEAARDAARAAQVASESARDAAQTAQASAESSATAASGSAASAAGSASDASASASAAGNAATQAEAAKTAAQTAQSAAEDAAEDAQQAAQQAHVEYEQLSGEVDDLSDEVAQQKSALTDLEAMTNRKAGMLVDTASGAIASFVPDATIPDLLGVSVDIEPVQDLHGYDSPWPAGGGVNLFPFENEFTEGWTTTVSDLTVKYSNGHITVKGTNNSGSYVFAVDKRSTWSRGTYTSGAGQYTPSNHMSVVCYVDGTANNVSSTVTASTSIEPTGFFIAVNSGQTVDWDIPLMFVRGSERPTTYSPYKNLCPITGWSEVGIESRGVNLIQPTQAGTSGTTSGITWAVNADGTVTASGTATGTTNVAVCNRVSMHPFAFNGVTLTLSTSPAISGVLAQADVYVNGVYKRTLTSSQSTGTFDAGNITFDMRYRIDSGTVIPAGTVLHPQIELGSSATAFKPYTGSTYTITLGQTVYGGTLDATAGTMTVDRAMVDFADLSWGYGSMFYAVLPNANVITSSDLICSVYPYDSSSGSDFSCYSVNGDIIRVRDSRYNSASSFQSALTGQKICYKLANTITIQLDPVTISTISGQPNNVWADAGDVTVEFAADLKHYIDSKIAAAVAALS